MKDKIVLIGMPGSGKSTIGKILAKDLNIRFYDMDEYIVKTNGKSILELFENGENYFRNIETQACKNLSKKKKILISTGGGIIKKSENIQMLKNESLIIFLDRPVEKILEDVDVSNRPLLKGKKEELINLYNERYKLYKEAADKIIVNDCDIETAIIRLKEILNKKK